MMRRGSWVGHFIGNGQKTRKTDQRKNLELTLSELFLKEFLRNLCGVSSSPIFFSTSFLSCFSLFCDSSSSRFCEIPRVFSQDLVDFALDLAHRCAFSSKIRWLECTVLLWISLLLLKASGKASVFKMFNFSTEFRSRSSMVAERFGLFACRAGLTLIWFIDCVRLSRESSRKVLGLRRAYSSTRTIDLSSWWSCFRCPLRCMYETYLGFLGSLPSPSRNLSIILEWRCSSSVRPSLAKALKISRLLSGTCSAHLLVRDDLFSSLPLPDSFAIDFFSLVEATSLASAYFIELTWLRLQSAVRSVGPFLVRERGRRVRVLFLRSTRKASLSITPMNSYKLPIMNIQMIGCRSIEEGVLQLGGDAEGRERNGQEVHQVVVLDRTVLPVEEHRPDVHQRERHHLHTHSVAEDAEQHQEDDAQVQEVPHPLRQCGQVGVAEGVHQQHPLVQELRDRLRVPPVEVEDPRPQLREFGHGEHDVLHDEVVEADVDVEGHGDEPEEELHEAHGAVGLGLDQRVDDLRHQDVVDQQARPSHAELYRQVRPVDRQRPAVLAHELPVDHLRRHDVLRQKDEEGPPRPLPLLLQRAAQLVDAVGGRLDRQGPAHHHDEDAVGEVEVDRIDRQQPAPHEETQPGQAVAVDVGRLALCWELAEEERAEVDLEEGEGDEGGDDCDVLDEVVGDGAEDVPLEQVALVDVVGDDVHEAEVDAALEQQALEPVELRLRQHRLVVVRVRDVQQRERDLVLPLLALVPLCTR